MQRQTRAVAAAVSLAFSAAPASATAVTHIDARGDAVGGPHLGQQLHRAR